MPKTLKPHALVEADYADVEAQLQQIFFDIVFKPVIELLRPHNEQVKAAEKELRNARVVSSLTYAIRLASGTILKNAVEDPIVAGLKSGRIQYTAGVFTGNFNVAISKALIKIGAKFDKRQKLYRLSPDEVPPAVRSMAHQYEIAAKKLHEELAKRLSATEDALDEIVERKHISAGVLLDKMQRGFNKIYGDALGKLELSEKRKAELNKEYTLALRPYIKKFTKEMIGEVRTAVTDNSDAGYRFDSLLKRLQSRYSISKTRAELIARTETARYVAKTIQSRFEDVGVTEYIWQTAGDSRVREDHRHLDGRKFQYANPPIIDAATGERGNPGETYNCRCVANPVLPADSVKAAITPRQNSNDNIQKTEHAENSNRVLQETI